MTSALRLVVSGATGRMGRTVAGLAAGDGSITLVGGLDRVEGAGTASHFPRVSTPREAEDLLRGCDAVIDFSAPSFLADLLESQREVLAGRAVVVGTTGLGATELELLDRAAERSAVLTAANFSLGVNLLLALVERAAGALGDDFDVEIVEAHHRRKEDAPSGTALALGEAVAEGRGVPLDQVRRDGRTGRPGARPRGEVGFHSLRGGDVIGDHQVHFIGALERLEIAHRASDRSLFGAGAIHAARWLAGRDPGRYSMRDVLGLE
jgi:4-hydroxy-tetrahydrodipicolinate reductase